MAQCEEWFRRSCRHGAVSDPAKHRRDMTTSEGGLSLDEVSDAQDLNVPVTPLVAGIHFRPKESILVNLRLPRRSVIASACPGLPRMSGERVLLVDDDESIRQVVSI